MSREGSALSDLGSANETNMERLSWKLRCLRRVNAVLEGPFLLADVLALLARTDLLVDGRYEESQRTTTRRYIGSDNQVLHFLSDRYAVDDARFAAPNTVELRVLIDKGTGALTINGWPVLGARTR